METEPHGSFIFCKFH